MVKKAQFSFEFLFAVGIVFFLFLLLLGFMMSRNQELGDSRREINKGNTCLLISSLITSAFINGDGVIINESIDYNVNVSEISPAYKELNVEGYYCLLAIHTVPNAQLSKGKIKIENQNNYIDLQNV